MREKRCRHPDQPPGGGGRTLRKLEWAVSLLLVASALALHGSLLLHSGAPWRDEVNSLNLATMRSLAGVWHFSQFDSFPMLWFLVLRSWITLQGGAGDIGLRLFGTLIGLFLLMALWRSTRRLGTLPPLFALVLVGLNPEVIRWGDSLRAYGLGTALLLLALGAIANLAMHPPTRKRVAWAMVISLLSVQCLYQNAVLLAAIGLAALAVTLRRRSWKRSLLVIAAGSPAALSLLLYIPTLAKAKEWMALNQTPFFSAQLVWARLSQATGPLGAIMIWLWLCLIGVSLAMAALAHQRSWTPLISDDERDHLLFSGVALGLGLLGYLVWLKLLSYPMQPWYFIVLMGFAAVCIDAVLSRARPILPVRRTRLAVVVVIAMLNLPVAWKALQFRQTNMDAVAKTLGTAANDRDLILVAPWYFAVSFGRYYRGSAAWMTLPPIGHPRLHRYDLVRKRMTESDPIASVFERVTETLESGHRVWVVGFLPAPTKEQAMPWLPPAPEGPFGWYSVAYDRLWGLQVSDFLRQHSGRMKTWTLGKRIESQGRASLTMATGWKPGAP